jgi:hypothetical protein
VEAHFSGGYIREVILARDAHGNPRPYNKDADYLEYIDARRRWSLFRTTSLDQQLYFSLSPGQDPMTFGDEELQRRVLGSTIDWKSILENFNLANLNNFKSEHTNMFKKFENAVKSFSDEDIMKLMFFWTGIPSLPYPPNRRLRLDIESGKKGNQGRVILATLCTAGTCGYLLRIPNKDNTQEEFTVMLRNVINAPQTHERND